MHTPDPSNIHAAILRELEKTQDARAEFLDASRDLQSEPHERHAKALLVLSYRVDNLAALAAAALAAALRLSTSGSSPGSEDEP